MLHTKYFTRDPVVSIDTHIYIHCVLTHTCIICISMSGTNVVLEAAIYRGRLTNAPIVANRRPSSGQGQNNHNSLHTLLTRAAEKDLVSLKVLGLNAVCKETNLGSMAQALLCTQI